MVLKKPAKCLIVEWDKDGRLVRLQGVEENPIVISTKKEEAETETLKLTLQYPELKGLENTEVQNKLNSLFAELAAAAKARGYENAQYLGEEQLKHHIKAETYFNYQVTYNRNGLLSIVFIDYQYGGGAHGMTVQSSYTFDVKTGKKYELKDFFDDGSDYIAIISDEVKRQIEEKGLMLLTPFNAIRPDQDFYLSNNGLVVYFQLYEYLPYAYGIPEFIVEI